MDEPRRPLFTESTDRARAQFKLDNAASGTTSEKDLSGTDGCFCVSLVQFVPRYDTESMENSFDATR